jgi:hypothetical protein
MTQDKRPTERMLGEIDDGNYVIPHFQRGFEWDPGMVCDLFSSILDGYYTGTLLLWDLENYNGTDDMWDVVEGVPPDRIADSPNYGILDGQQRLSSIYYALYSPQMKFPSRKSYYYFYLDMDACLRENFDDAVTYVYRRNPRDEDDLKERMPELLPEDGRFPLCLLRDHEYRNSEAFEACLAEYYERRNEPGHPVGDLSEMNLYREFNTLFDQILNYRFSVEILDTSNLEEVCEIFTRINKKGMTLSTFDLMNAFLFPYDISLRKDWEELEGYDDLKAVDSTMNTNVLKTIGLRKRDYCSSKYIYQLIPGTEVERRDATGASRTEVPIRSATEFRNLWEVGIEYCEEARQRIINTGTNDFGAIKNDFIPHTTMLPVLAALLWEYGEQFDKTVPRTTFDDRIVRWYWSAALSRDYSGSSDSIMAQDFREMKAWFEDADEIPERIQTVDTEFIDQNLDLQNVTQGGRYSAVLGLYGLNAPKDFHTGRRLGTYNADRIDDHHIFPKNVDGLMLPPERKHSILNRALILDETNREQIQNRKPSDYLQDMESADESIEERLCPHLIPEEGVEALWNDDFEDFIEARERAVLREIKESLSITGT